jgi:beta-glucosidase
MNKKPFPDDFLWGASTSGHQVEGGNYDQWTVWELAHAAKLAETAADRLRWLPEWMKIKDQAEKPENYVSGRGVEHRTMYKEDFALIKGLNLNCFRFGIEWSRIEPDRGVWDKKAIDYYHNYIAEMKKQGIEPILNLWHWTQPVWFDELGGFAHGDNVRHFERFVTKIAEEFGDQVKYILTLNEPNVYVLYPEFNGGVPVPPQQPLWKRLRTFFALVKAHKKAYAILKAHNPDLQISAAVQMAYNAPKKDNFISRTVANLSAWAFNHLFYDLVKKQVDFIGFNYYFTNYYNNFKLDNPKSPVNDLGWYMEPASLAEVITRVWLRYRKPIMITENGVADGDDQYRQWWLRESMQAMMTAQKAGAELIGYLHWSLLDNFEWVYGWWPHFGLVKVDREHGMKRTPRPSAIWWAKQLAILKKQK